MGRIPPPPPPSQDQDPGKWLYEVKPRPVGQPSVEQLWDDYKATTPPELQEQG